MGIEQVWAHSSTERNLNATASTLLEQDLHMALIVGCLHILANLVHDHELLTCQRCTEMYSFKQSHNPNSQYLSHSSG